MAFISGSELTFGFEVECRLPESARNLIPVGNASAGLSIPMMPDWKGKSDVSIRNRSGYFTVEVVSPVLKGESGLVEIVAMLDWLKDLGADFDSESGIHTHVGTGYCSQESMTAFRAYFRKYELAFFGLNGHSTSARYAGHWCKPSQYWYNLTDRYASLNVSQQYNRDYHRKPTAECRVYAGTIDPFVAVTAVCSLVALYSAFTDGKRNPDNSRIGTCSDSARAFVRECLYPTKYRIVPDCDMLDMSKTFYSQCKIGTQQLGIQAS